MIFSFVAEQLSRDEDFVFAVVDLLGVQHLPIHHQKLHPAATEVN